MPAEYLVFSNTVVNIHASPATDWSFLQWLGDATGSSPDTSVAVQGHDPCIEAVFGTRVRTSISKGGSLALSPNMPLYPYGTELRLYAVPPPNYRFLNWMGAIEGTNNPATLIVTNADPFIFANCIPLTGAERSLTVVIEGSGVVLPTSAANTYLDGTIITLVPLTKAGQRFLSWSGAASGTQAPLSLVITSSIVLTGHFSSAPILALPPCFEPSVEDGFRLFVVGRPGTTYEIQKNQSWNQWSYIATVTNQYGTVQVRDAFSTNASVSIYRALIR
jgi:hypothetical protein